MEIALKYYEDWTLMCHAMNVGTMSAALAQRVGLDADECFEAGLLHDVGKKYKMEGTHAAMSYFIIVDEEKYNERVARLALYHHQFQKNVALPQLELDDEDAFNKEAELIALCDKTEAFISRAHYIPKKAISAACEQFPFQYANVLREIMDVTKDVNKCQVSIKNSSRNMAQMNSADPRTLGVRKSSGTSGTGHI